MEGEYEERVVDELVLLQGCSTPKREEFQIPMMSVPPPPPRKKRCEWGGKMQQPKNGYFHPPDLELLFTVPAPRRQACA